MIADLEININLSDASANGLQGTEGARMGTDGHGRGQLHKIRRISILPTKISPEKNDRKQPVMSSLRPNWGCLILTMSEDSTYSELLGFCKQNWTTP